MIIHACVPVSACNPPELIFEDLFGMKLLYDFPINPDIMRTLFHAPVDCQARVYEAGNTRIEVFILEEPVPRPGPFHHLCLEVPDSKAIIKKAEKMGFEIRQYQRPDSEVVFIIDKDGNLYEIKQINGTSS